MAKIEENKKDPPSEKASLNSSDSEDAYPPPPEFEENPDFSNLDQVDIFEYFHPHKAV